MVPSAPAESFIDLLLQASVPERDQRQAERAARITRLLMLLPLSAVYGLLFGYLPNSTQPWVPYALVAMGLSIIPVFLFCLVGVPYLVWLRSMRNRARF